jgi:hypothetical protein
MGGQGEVEMMNVKVVACHYSTWVVVTVCHCSKQAMGPVAESTVQAAQLKEGLVTFELVMGWLVARVWAG